MATVLTSQDGKRRCDGTCHNAKHAHCTCICGGKFHGANVARSKETERAELEELILKKTVTKAASEPILDSPNQPLLFESIDDAHERAAFHLSVAAAQRKMIGA